MYPDAPQMSGPDRYAKMNANSDAANSAADSIAKGVKTQADSGSAMKRVDENAREVGTANRVINDTSVATLEKMASAGFPTEVSGDALARAKKGQTPKLHRS